MFPAIMGALSAVGGLAGGIADAVKQKRERERLEQAQKEQARIAANQRFMPDLKPVVGGYSPFENTGMGMGTIPTLLAGGGPQLQMDSMFQMTDGPAQPMEQDQTQPMQPTQLPDPNVPRLSMGKPQQAPSFGVNRYGR